MNLEIRQTEMESRFLDRGCLWQGEVAFPARRWLAERNRLLQMYRRPLAARSWVAVPPLVVVLPDGPGLLCPAPGLVPQATTDVANTTATKAVRISDTKRRQWNAPASRTPRRVKSTAFTPSPTVARAIFGHTYPETRGHR